MTSNHEDPTLKMLREQTFRNAHLEGRKFQNYSAPKYTPEPKVYALTSKELKAIASVTDKNKDNEQDSFFWELLVITFKLTIMIAKGTYKLFKYIWNVYQSYKQNKQTGAKR